MRVGQLACTIVFMLLSVAASSAQQGAARLAVVISDHETGRPLSGVNVALDGLKVGGITNENGAVELQRIPAGTHMVRIHSLGYRTETFAAEFAPGARVEAEIDLLPEAIALSGITVEAERLDRALSSVGFYDRKASSGGVFLTSEIWDKFPGTELSTVLRRVPGIGITRYKTKRGNYVSRIGSGRSIVSLSKGGQVCWSKVYLDGFLQFDSDEDPFDISRLAADQIGAIEVYRGPAETPPQFNATGAACGVVLLWTKASLGVQ